MRLSLITSRQNPRIKRASQLRTAKGRAEQHRIIIDGVREIERALLSGVEVAEIFASQESLNSDDGRLESIINQASSAHSFELPSRVFEKICFGNRNEGLVAVATTPKRSLAQFEIDAVNATIGVLEGIEKPGNLGAIVRSADAAGMDGILVCDAQSDLFNPNAIRASLGTIFSMPIAEVSSHEAIDWLSMAKTIVYVTRVDGEKAYSQIDLQRRSAIVLGSEANGVSEVWQSADFVGVKLPMCGIADSLNVSATAAVLFYEANRQKGAN